MLNRKVHPDAWQRFFDALSKERHTGGQATFAKLRLVIPEMAGTLDMAHWLPLIGITYDPKDRTLYVMMEGLTHRVNQPDVVWASVASEGYVDTLLVLRRDGSSVSIELSNHRFPHDPSLFRRDPSSRFARKGYDKSRDLWSRLVALRTGRRKDEAADPKGERRSPGRETDAGLPGQGHSLRLPHPRMHRPSRNRMIPAGRQPQ